MWQLICERCLAIVEARDELEEVIERLKICCVFIKNWLIWRYQNHPLESIRASTLGAAMRVATRLLESRAMRRIQRRAQQRRLCLESLEDRNLLAGANLGFETVEPIGTFWPNQLNDWNGDFGSIVELENGITPLEGSRMLRFDSAAPTPSATNLGASQVEQLIDPSSLGDVSSGTLTVTASAWFNRVAGDSQTDSEFFIRLLASDRSPSTYPSDKEAGRFGPIELTFITTDDDPATWEKASVNLTLPATTTFIALEVAAIENVFNDYRGVEYDGHYADRVTIVGENRPPTLDAIPGIEIDEDSPEQVVGLTGISAGDGEVQPLRVTATSSNTGLIPSPTVSYTTADSTGSLAFTPAPDEHGTATITVTVEDGGPDQDLTTTGDNATFSRSFNVTVNSVIDALIDLKPGGGDSPINLGSRGRTPIAILSTQTAAGEPDDFDATLVDLSAIAFKINGTSIAADQLTLEDVDGDGDLDLLIHFLTQDLAKILTPDSVDLVLTAEFGGDALGDDLAGSDGIKVVPPKKKDK